MKKLSNNWIYVALLSFSGTWFVTTQSSCTPGARTTAAVTGIQVALCVAENQDLPPTEVVAKCIQENVTPDDVMRILAEQKRATDKAAARRANCAGNRP